MNNYETPLWTLIGVIIGFVLSIIYSNITQRKQLKEKTYETIERIKKLMHLGDNKFTIQKIADLLPQFREEEQLHILMEIGMESSLNYTNNAVTKYVIEELKWMCILYELDSDFRHNLIKKSNKDEKKLNRVIGILWEITINISEYTKSNELLDLTFDFVNTLARYSINQNYIGIIREIINYYKNIAQSSLKYKNFQYGVSLSLNNLGYLKQIILNSNINNSNINQFTKSIDRTIEYIKSDIK